MTISGARFMPGIELSKVLYEEAVRPLLGEVLPGLRYAAARVGSGSEVLGFDTPRSADHEWGPRLQIFLTAEDHARHGADIRRMLATRLPKQVRGWPTHFQERDDPLDPVGRMQLTDGPVNHRVDVYDLGGWLAEQLGLRTVEVDLSVRTWLAMPQQRLAETTGGAVFHDALGTLTDCRRRLEWYPEQVWRYLLACQWQRISQEEAFVGRCAEVGDDIGAAVVAARLVRDLMRLCLLLERRYAPYGKWLGSAFGRLTVAESLAPVLRGVLAATDYPTREAHLCDAYEAVASLQNASGLITPTDPNTRRYHSRPFLVLHAERFAQALAGTVTDPDLCTLPLVGSVDQWTDSTDLLSRPHAIRAATSATGHMGMDTGRGYRHGSGARRMTSDNRIGPPGFGSERETLRAFLDYHRATLAMKCEGLTDEELRQQSMPPSTLSLLGLVRHMAEVERAWFRRVFEDHDAPMVWSDEIDFQAAYDASASTRAEAFTAWEAEVAHSRRVEREAESLDLAGYQPRWGEEVSLRMVMVHVLLEYGRHNGHADFLREGVDGAVGA